MKQLLITCVPEFKKPWVLAAHAQLEFAGDTRKPVLRAIEKV